MATPTLTLPEVRAMLETVDVPLKFIMKFEQHARFVLDKRAPLTREDDNFEVGSGYSHAKGTGHVKFKTGGMEHQMDPRKAKQIGLWLLEAAEASINDAVVMQLLRTKVKMEDPARLGAILLDLREIRQGTRDTKYEP
jgi:hypothetical protein